MEELSPLFRFMAIFPAQSCWGRNVVGFLWMARTPSLTTLRTWMFATTITSGRGVRSAVALKFALTSADGSAVQCAKLKPPSNMA